MKLFKALITIILVLFLATSANADVSIAENFDSYSFTRSDFWIAKDTTGDYQVRSFDKAYEHWPSEYYPHLLIIWLRTNDGVWHMKGVTGIGYKFTMAHKKEAYKKSKDLTEVIDAVHPEGVVAFSYLVMFHEAVIYLGEMGVGSVKDIKVYEKLRDNLNRLR